ncbi:MAG: hypothetical protein AAF926_07585 [Pseudomonadota bacterium]
MTDCRAFAGTALWCLAIPFAATPALAGGPAYTPDLVPPNPVAGECYARVKIPARYETATQTVVTREAHSIPQVQPPKFETQTQNVMVREASVRYEVRQPTYATVKEKIVTRPAFDKLSVTPPRFHTRTETLQTSAPRLVWKHGNPAQLRTQGYVIHSMADAGFKGQGYHSTQQYGATGGTKCGPICEIWCLVEEPGDSVTIERQVMTEPGRIHRTRVPARTETITKQVVKDPGGVRKIPVPAEYRAIHVDQLVHPGGETSVQVPAQYGHVQSRKLVQDERYEWRRVVCANRTVTTSHVTRPSTAHVSTTQSSTTRSSAVPSTGTTHIIRRSNPPSNLHPSRYQGTMKLPALTQTRTHQTSTYQGTMQVPQTTYQYDRTTQSYRSGSSAVASGHETQRYRTDNYGASAPAYAPPPSEPAPVGPARIRR